MSVALAPTPDDLAHFERSEAGGRFPIAADIKARIVVERAVVRRAITDILAAGYLVRLHDGESWATGLEPNIDRVMAELCACDEERLYVWKPRQGDEQDGKYIGSIYLVYGNEGWDVLADYSVNLEPLLAGANEFAETLSE